MITEQGKNQLFDKFVAAGEVSPVMLDFDQVRMAIEPFVVVQRARIELLKDGVVLWRSEPCTIQPGDTIGVSGIEGQLEVAVEPRT